MVNIELTCHLHTRPGKMSFEFTSFGFEARINRSIGALRITGSSYIITFLKEHDEQVPDEDIQVDDAGELIGFWGDLGRPLEDYTHIIIDSPHLVLNYIITFLEEHDEQVPDEDNQVDDGEDN
ncbi:hypothetical protein RhiirA5_437126 [Rhizophagus irregularis]|uniref:Uncharacterized protein n=1 Tax=Rhizophagus irregularis TaxID=588596 RepID=A0A2N0NKX0_9GLOM|nr:hypothetical protein RhiirA5_437126 [Rhizophagus irregularis]